MSQKYKCPKSVIVKWVQMSQGANDQGAQISKIRLLSCGLSSQSRKIGVAAGLNCPSSCTFAVCFSPQNPRLDGLSMLGKPSSRRFQQAKSQSDIEGEQV